MEVIRIDEIFVIFNNVKFKKDKRSGYYWTVTIPRKSLHLSVFEFHGGVRPEGHEIHHKDFDKENNNSGNLICLSPEEHRRIHIEYLQKTRDRNWNNENLKKAHAKLSEWRKTDEYKKWLEETKDDRVKWAKISIAKLKLVLIRVGLLWDIPTGVKVKKIIVENKEEMTYNLHVDKYNNFPIDGGLIVHNSIKATMYGVEQLSNLKGPPMVLSGSKSDHKKDLIEIKREERKKKREVLKAQARKKRLEKKT